MVRQARRIGVTLALLLCALPAHAHEPGMFLCPSPLIAHGFWTDLIAAQSLGINIDFSVATQIAKKDNCPRINSNNLRPVQAGWAGMLNLTDGTASGWAEPEYYVIYTNRPK